MDVDVDLERLGRVAVLGVVGGLRSQLPLALLALAARSGRFAADARDAPLRWLRHRAATVGLGLAAAGELVGDKLPMVPPRIEPPSLIGRSATGALVGAAVARESGQPLLPGTLVGVAGAIAGSYGGYYARRGLGRLTGLPDPFWGGVEDVVALGLGALAVRPWLLSGRDTTSPS